METKLMTKERLSAYIHNKAAIAEINFKLEHAAEYATGNDVIFDYQKGYPRPLSVVGCDYDKYIKRKERLNKKKEEYQKENDEIEEFINSIHDSLQYRIFTLYFIDGLRQDKVAEKVNMERSSISKKIDDYLQLSHNSHQSHV